MSRLVPSALALLVLAGLARPASAGPDLPVVDEVAWGPFRAHVLTLLDGLEGIKAPLPVEVSRQVRDLLPATGPRDPDATVQKVQTLLDPFCLLGVHINPESRVKAAPGPREPVALLDRPAYVLVKVHNEGGVTHALRIYGDELIHDGKKGAERWLEAAVLHDKPFDRLLSGRRLEYRVLKLQPRQAGKREATLAFDVGQGTQDLGFRAEVPLLFHVKKDRD